MNFSQIHERLRQEVSRRVNRGLLTGSFLASQTGLQPSHISNFLARRRKLSLAALDRVLEVLSLSVDELAFTVSSKDVRGQPWPVDGSRDRVPLISAMAAIRSPLITKFATLEIIELPAGILENLVPRLARARRNWQRFVAVRIDAKQAEPMAPILNPGSILVLDRHYNALAAYRPPQPSLYGVSFAGALIFRYVSLLPPHLVLRPWSLQHPVELLELGDTASLADYIVGRVCLRISQL